ncbi:MAG: hypothetical protein KI785_09710, partial [Devosiaceae bacterium]|nr:hypothetical protein [Devosiaceae bacterium MH13]
MAHTANTPAAEAPSADASPSNTRSQGFFSVRTLKRLSPLIVIAGAMGAAFAFGLHEQISLSNLIQQREALAGFIGDNYL